jgi:hypothetical protein
MRASARTLLPPSYPYSGHQVHDYELLSAPAPVDRRPRVWHDVNANGIQDPGEPGLANVLVKLIDSKGNTAQVTTNATGYFLLAAMPTRHRPTCARTAAPVASMGWMAGRRERSTCCRLCRSPFTSSVALDQLSPDAGRHSDVSHR